jgi:hypothetical protein
VSELFVVVTIVDNGVVHAWGEGPVVGGEVVPFATRDRARSVARQFGRGDEDGKVEVRTCKLLGIEPVTVATYEEVEA